MGADQPVDYPNGTNNAKLTMQPLLLQGANLDSFYLFRADEKIFPSPWGKRLVCIWISSCSRQLGCAQVRRSSSWDKAFETALSNSLTPAQQDQKCMKRRGKGKKEL